MYRIFDNFNRDTLAVTAEAVFIDKNDRTYKLYNPVELAAYHQYKLDYRASADHRDISKLAQALVKTVVSYGRTPEDYANMYNDYMAFLDDWTGKETETELRVMMGLAGHDVKPTEVDPVAIPNEKDIIRASLRSVVYDTYVYGTLDRAVGQYIIDLLHTDLTS